MKSPRALIALSLGIAFLPTVVQAKEPRSATPLGNPGAWISSRDYPTTALHDNLEGISVFVLTVDKNGRVSNCQIVQSSGSGSLDDATCNLITLRAIFEPATDRSGKPVEGTYSNRVRWQIPTELPALHTYAEQVSIVVDEDGEYSDCKVEKFEATQEGASREKYEKSVQQWCDSHSSEAYLDAAGNPMRVRITKTSSVSVEPIR